MAVTPTENHGYKKQDKGDEDWHIALNDTLDLLDVDVVLKDTSGNRPSAGTEGRAFLETDTKKLFYDNGTSWELMLSLSYSDLTDTSNSIGDTELANTESFTVGGLTSNGGVSIPDDNLVVGDETDTGFTFIELGRSNGTDNFTKAEFFNSAGDYILRHNNQSQGTTPFQIISQNFGRIEMQVSGTTELQIPEGGPVTLPNSDLEINASTLTLGDSDGSDILMEDTGSAPSSNYRLVNGAGNFVIRENGDDRVAFTSGGPIQVKNVNVDMQGQALKDNSGNLKLQPDGSNIEIAAGNRIFDDDGNRRIRLAANNTSMFDGNDNNSLFFDTSLTRLSIQDGKTFDVFDGPQNTKGLEYVPSTDGVAPGNVNIPAANLNVAGGDISLGTGQSIEDGNGTERLSLESGFTSLKDENGNNAFSADDGVEVRLEARNGTPIQVRDAEGTFDALTYSTSSSPPGTLELTNANLNASGNSVKQVRNVIGTGDLNLDTAFGETGNSVRLRNGDNRDILLATNSGLVAIPRGNLQIETDQSIEDGAGTERVKLSSGQTEILDAAGTQSFMAGESTFSSASANTIRATSSSDIVFVDIEQGADGVRYIPSSSAPGTFELTNAKLDVTGENKVEFGGGEYFVRYDSGDDTLKIGSTENGEVAEIDSAGNMTIEGSLTQNGSVGS